MPRVYSPVWNALRDLTKISFDLAAVVAATKRVARLRTQGRRTQPRPVTDNGGISAVTKTIFICSPVGSPRRRRMLMSAQDINLPAPCS
jgi:hypothetical protein